MKKVKVIIAQGFRYEKPDMRNRNTYTCIVAGCDPDIGITLVEKSNTKSIIWCLSGILAAKHNKWDEYKIKFDEAVRQIETGTVDVDKVREIAGVPTSPRNGSNSRDLAAMCPYNQ